MGPGPFTLQDQPLMLEAGITKVAHLQAALQSQHPQAFTACLQSILLALPPPWQAIAAAAPAAPAWHQGLSASGSQVIQHLPTRQQHSISHQHQLLPTSAQAVSALGPVHVIPWDPSRPWRGPAQQPAQPTAALYSQGQLWGPGHLSLGVWGWGQQPAHQLVVRQASQRLRLIQARKHGILAPGALTCQPRLLPLPGSGLTPTQVLQALESRWTASLQASPASRTRLSSDMPDSQPAWMALSRGHRQHWSQRQQQQQAQQQQQPSEQPRQRHSNKATVGDTLDVLAPPDSHPQLSEWRNVWELASAAFFDRQHRVLWAYIGRATMEQACCPHACCSGPPQPQTISHLFLECPVATTVISWLCRLWQAMTGHLPAASVATILAASTSDGQWEMSIPFRQAAVKDARRT
ncbi:hypothetical protein ABBQ32_014107 [Trebouxia sp. C0010 RCD-2024]